MLRRTFHWLALVLVLISGCGQKPSPMTDTPEKSVVRVAAASDLKYALDEMIGEFEKQYADSQVKVTYGSSGNFFAQLSNEAPFDIYLSADIEYARKLIKDGQADKESEFPYALGRIVVWVRNESTLEVEKLGVQVLVDPAVRKIAIANPKHAPYGRAAESALKHFDIYEQVEQRFVLGENIAQTAQFVESGAADVGVIALSLAMAPALKDKGRYWLIPLDAHPKLEQGGVILNWAKDRKAAEQLRAFITAEAGRAILKRYGFLMPGEE